MKEKKPLNPLKKKPFKCNICKQCSSRKDQMKQHVQSVHEEYRPFQCGIYDYNCSLKSNMKKHVFLVMKDISHSSVMNGHVTSVHERKKIHSKETFVATAFR